MSVQSISNSQNIQKTASVHNYNSPVSDGSMLKVYDTQEKTPTKVKAGVAAMVLSGVAAAMYLTLNKKAKIQGVGDFFKKLTTVTYKEKHEVEWLVVKLALASVGSGLLGGAIFDKKENLGAKCREAVIQLIGNIFIPLGMVLLGMNAVKHFGAKMPHILPAKSKQAKAAEVLTSLVCLLGGILVGNKVGNEINKKFFRIDDKRNLKLSDMSPHIDDLCVITSIAAKEYPAVPRFIPAALLIAGFSTGMVQEKPHIKAKFQNQ